MPKNKKKRLLNSLVPLLRGMRGKPVIIELKNSTTIEGLVIQIDNFMKYVGIVHGRYFALQSIYSNARSFEMERVIARRHQNVQISSLAMHTAI